MDRWFDGGWIDGSMVRWLDGTMVRWFDGSMVRWYDGTMVRWFDGTMVRWYDGTMVRWFDGSRVRWPDSPPLNFHCFFISCSLRNAYSSSPEPGVREFEGSNVRVPGCLHCYQMAHAWVRAWVGERLVSIDVLVPSLQATRAPRRAPFGSSEAPWYSNVRTLELSNPGLWA